MTIPIAKPKMNPARTARERKFETQPIRRTPRTRYTAPATRASAAAHGTASSVPIAAAPTSGVMTAVETAATVALGPWITCLEVPKIAYAIRATKAV